MRALPFSPSTTCSASQIEITVNSENDGAHIYGIRISLLGINFHLSTSKTIKVEKMDSIFHRPQCLDIARGGDL